MAQGAEVVLFQSKCICESNDGCYNYYKEHLDKNTDIIYSPQTCQFSGVPKSYLKKEPSEKTRHKNLSNFISTSGCSFLHTISKLSLQTFLHIQWLKFVATSKFYLTLNTHCVATITCRMIHKFETQL